jgi:hypothetical protein
VRRQRDRHAAFADFQSVADSVEWDVKRPDAMTVSTFENNDKKVHIEYPSAWHASPEAAGPMILVVEADQPRLPNGYSAALLLFSVPPQQVGAEVPLATVADAVMGELTRNCPDLKKLESTAATIGGKPALAMTLAGHQGEIGWRFRVVVSINHDRIYDLVLMVDEHHAAEFKPTFDKIVSSWKWLE